MERGGKEWREGRYGKGLEERGEEGGGNGGEEKGEGGSVGGLQWKGRGGGGRGVNEGKKGQAGTPGGAPAVPFTTVPSRRCANCGQLLSSSLLSLSSLLL